MWGIKWLTKPNKRHRNNCIDIIQVIIRIIHHPIRTFPCAQSVVGLPPRHTDWLIEHVDDIREKPFNQTIVDWISISNQVCKIYSAHSPGPELLERKWKTVWSGRDPPMPSISATSNEGVGFNSWFNLGIVSGLIWSDISHTISSIRSQCVISIEIIDCLIKYKYRTSREVKLVRSSFLARGVSCSLNLF